MENAQREPFPKRRLGDFDIVRELGRGGMGIVYEARQISLNRKVALKVLGTSLGMTSKAVVRFRREAEAAAKLHHTNIVPIYATGEHEGTHFYAMELVEGPSLNFVIRELKTPDRDGRQLPPDRNAESVQEAESTETQQLPGDLQATVGESTASVVPAWVAETFCLESSSAGSSSGVSDSSSTLAAGNDYIDTAAKMIADVADGLGYAHNHGVIHRDMKPSNLLLSPDGRLSINDFGLARMLEQPGMTMTGEFVGSPLYMSPEQIAAGRVALDHRTDIYSLGATLYELITLQPPFPGERRDQIIGQILYKEPKRPRRINKKIPVDLETICLKAMEKDPDRRYQTAGQMAEDLRKFVNRFAISAKRSGVLSRTNKWMRRHPGVAALLALVVLAGSAAGIAGYQAHLSNLRVQALRLQAAKEDAILAAWNGEFESAESKIQEAEQFGASHAWTRMLRGQVALHQGRPADAIVHLEQAERLMPGIVAPKAMLALALLLDGRWDEFVMYLGDLEKLTPTTPEDFLFLGWAFGIHDPVRGLEALDKAVAMRPASPMARVVRARVGGGLALETGRIKDVEAALDDARTAKGMMGETASVSEVHMWVHLVAAVLYEKNGEMRLRDEALGQCDEDARTLARFVDLPGAYEIRAQYFALFGREDEVLEEWGRATQAKYASDDAFRQYAFGLYRNGEFDRAMSVIDALSARSSSGHGELTRAYIHLFMARETVFDDAMNAYRTAMARGDSTLFTLWYQTVPRLLGKEEEVASQCPRLAKSFARIPDWLFEWYGKVLRYHCGEISADELLSHAKLLGHFTEAHYLIGVKHLSEGRRALAIKSFQDCVATGVFIYWEADWARLFLERLAQDPTWPPWIPVRDGNQTERTGGAPSSNGDREE